MNIAISKEFPVLLQHVKANGQIVTGITLFPAARG